MFHNLLPTISGLTNEEISSLQNQLKYDATTNVSLGICELNNINHFYTVYDPSITFNNNIQLNVIEFCFNNSDIQQAYKVVNKNENGLGSDFLNQSVANDSTYLTTIFLVYNLDGPIKVEFFALTRVPKRTTLLGATVAYQNAKNTLSYINFTTNPTDTTLTNTNVLNSSVTLTWNALQYGLNQANVSWYNKGNVILLEDVFGYSEDVDKLTCNFANNTNELTATIYGSGTHILSFKDLAGNVHLFTNGYSTQSTYKIILIDSVIYHINYNDKDYNPIQYGTFNDSLTMIIDNEYLASYFNLNVAVTRNGNAYYDYLVEDNVYTFSDSGRYTLTITALYGAQKTALNNAIYNFNIINSNSARLAYEFVEIAGYEILNITRNRQDITDNFRNENGKVLSVFISSTSASSGNGYYSITLRYGKRASEILTYTFTINDYIPTISCNIPHGETTTGSIILTYNPSVIYEQLGDCYIKILTYNSDSKSFYNYSTISVDADSFTSTSAASFEITRSNSYFIQVETKNGNVLSSFRVNKTDPLNTMAIIIIVIAVVAVIVLIIVVIKLRTRMKVR